MTLNIWTLIFLSRESNCDRDIHPGFVIVRTRVTIISPTNRHRCAVWNAEPDRPVHIGWAAAIAHPFWRDTFSCRSHTESVPIGSSHESEIAFLAVNRTADRSGVYGFCQFTWQARSSQWPRFRDFWIGAGVHRTIEPKLEFLNLTDPKLVVCRRWRP
jgi:hypothetical protein